MKLHHVQVIMPVGGDDGARAFWRDAVGLTEVSPPPELAGRPVRWFRAFDFSGATTLEVHVLADEGFVPVRLGVVSEIAIVPDNEFRNPSLTESPEVSTQLSADRFSSDLEPQALSSSVADRSAATPAASRMRVLST